MKEKLTKEEVGFAQIKNEVLQDKNLSLKAKGLFAYLYSKPNDWEFSGDRMTSENLDGRKSIYSALKELESAGYLQRIKRPDGKVDYYVTYTKEPIAQKGQEVEKPVDQKGKEPKRQLAEKGSISNKDFITNTDIITNNEEKLTKKTEKFISEVKECFGETKLDKHLIPRLQEFVVYWTEPDKNWKEQREPKIRYDHQKTWDMKRRIGTWMRNQVKFGGSSEPKQNKYKATMVGVNK